MRKGTALVVGATGITGGNLASYLVASCRVPDDQMSYRSYPLLAAKELLHQFIREQGYGHQAT